MIHLREWSDTFVDDLSGVFGARLQGIVIHGSWTLDDFRPGHSDLDYVVLVENNLSDDEIEALFELHDAYRCDKTSLLSSLEGTTYPVATLADPSQAFVGCYIGTGRSGWRRITAFANGLVDLVAIRQCGEWIFGNPVQVYEPTKEDLAEEMERSAKQVIDALADTRYPVSVGVHWYVRTEYFLHHGRITSKSAACEWYARQNPNDCGAALAERSKETRHPYENRAYEYEDAGVRQCLIAMVEDTRERIRDWRNREHTNDLGMTPASDL